MAAPANSVDTLCEQAQACLARRDLDGASTLYEQAIQENPDSIAAHDGLASIRFAQQDYARAAELFNRLSQLDPKRPDPFINLGATYNKLGDFQQAMKALRQALSRDRKNAVAYYNLGTAQRGAKQLSMAVSAYKEAIRLDPELAEAYIQLGGLLLEMKNLPQAISNFERALQLRPNSKSARAGLEQARNSSIEAKKAYKPFGRLVNLEEVEERQNQAAAKFRRLSDHERFDDRTILHRLAKEAERCAVASFNQVKGELSPGILALTRQVGENPDPRAWSRDIEHLRTAIERYQQFADILQSKLDELRAHEKTIRS